jgi:DNA polymerase V
MPSTRIHDTESIGPVDLVSQIVKHPAATFMLRIRGQSMKDAGIFDDDVVLVDKSIRPRTGHVVIAIVDGEFVCKTLVEHNGSIVLKAANPTYPDIRPKEGQFVEIWGVVIAAVKKF